MQQLQLPIRSRTPATGKAQESCPMALSPRKRQVLALYLSGHQRIEVAQRLDVSPHTVRNHIRLVYESLGFSNRIEALRWALAQPSLANEIMTLSTPSTRSVPLNLEQAVAEAIAFFQREVTDQPLEIT